MVETIKFNNATGSFLLDFTINNRQTLFGDTPTIKVVSQDATPEFDVLGFGKNYTYDPDTRVLTQVLIDGVNGKGYIQISK